MGLPTPDISVGKFLLQVTSECGASTAHGAEGQASSGIGDPPPRPLPEPPSAETGTEWQRLRGNQKQIIFGIMALEPRRDIAHFSSQTKAFSEGSILPGEVAFSQATIHHISPFAISSCLGVLSFL